MPTDVRLLIIEDVEDHALLMVRELRKGGFNVDFLRVETRRELDEALDSGRWDAVISDYNLPGFNGLDALRTVQAKADVPFILVSGAIGEEVAAELMKAGAHDYIRKGNLVRLAPTLERELRDAATRNERRQTAEELARYREHLEDLVRERTEQLEGKNRALQESEERYRALFETTPDAIFLMSGNNIILSANGAAREMFGMNEEEIRKAGHLGLFDPGDPRMGALLEECARTGCCHGTATCVRKDGSRLQAEMVSVLVPSRQFSFVVLRDITKRVQAENALRQSEALFRGVFENAAVGMSLVDRSGKFILVNSRLQEILGYPEEELRGVSFDSLTFPDDVEPDHSNFARLMQGELESYSVEKRYIGKDGTRRWVRVTRAAQQGESGVPGYSINVAEDISARKDAESSRDQAMTLLRAVTENTPDFIFVKDRDGHMLMANPATLENLGKSPEEVLGKTDAQFLGGKGAEEIMENDRRVMESGETLVVEEVPHPEADGRVYLSTKSPYRDAEGNIIGLIGISRDITERITAAKERDRLLAEVQRSNHDLQQFAYIASHDLQEPLRMVSSFLQLLDSRYREQLDDKARKYIEYAVDGAKRMQRLIDGLLAYSRISGDEQRAPIDLDQAFAAALANVQETVRETGGEVVADPLPTVPGDETQLIQLLQNLIGNGLKYCRPDVAPRVHVSARRGGGEWIFSVSDNGIGIEPQHFDRIFQIFQRLHTRDEYPGTGIGLASCKKIVERHGGRMWVESHRGEGSVFYFSIPAEGDDDVPT